MGFKQHISRTWQMIEQQVNDVPFRPHNEVTGRCKERGKQRSPDHSPGSGGAGGEDRPVQGKG